MDILTYITNIFYSIENDFFYHLRLHLSHFGQFLRTAPQDMYDDNITEEHNDDWQNKRYDELVVHEHNTIIGTSEVTLGTRYDDSISRVIVENAQICILKNICFVWILLIDVTYVKLLQI